MHVVFPGFFGWSEAALHKEDMRRDVNRYIRFDWAMKRLLRDKANHRVLEGLLTSLLGKEIRIKALLESESNRQYEENKQNRVDILAENSEGEKILIEIQNETEDSYFHRMLFGTSRLVSEYLQKGQDYGKTVKVYSVNIVYFDLGTGDDDVYIGTTEFRGLHTGTLLELPKAWAEKYNASKVHELFPEYYVLRVNNFDRWSRTPLDQWMYFLSTGLIPDDATAPGLETVRERMRVDLLSAAQREDYYAYLDSMVSTRSMVETAHNEGLWEGKLIGREEGMKIGMEKARIEMAVNLKKAGISLETIAAVTGLSSEKIEQLLVND